MLRSIIILTLVTLAFFPVGCEGEEGQQEGERAAGPCAGEDPPEACGRTCSDDDPCPTWFYCQDGACTQDCRPDSEESCGDEICGLDGRCKTAGSDAGETVAGSGGSDGPDGGTSGAGSQPIYDAGIVVDGANVCARSVPATKLTPNVIIIIDQSATMDTAFTGADDRWDALRTALVGEQGLIKKLQDVVRFGIALYSGSYHAPECPLLTVAPQKDPSSGEVEVKLGAYAEIDEIYRAAETVGETPTGDAIEAILGQIAGSALTTGSDPTIFILATDGEPDRCEQLDPDGTAGAREEAIEAIRRAYDEYGIKTFVIAVAEEDELSQEHVNDLANAGQGLAAEPGEAVADSYRVSSTDALVSTLASIVGGHLTCVIDLQGRVTNIGDGCAYGKVELNGTAIPCDDQDGWKLINDRQLELFGTPCDDLLDDPDSTVSAFFPCTVIELE